MDAARAPGLAFEPVQPIRPAGPLARADIAAFLGYSRRGPAGVAVRIGSARQFDDLFGPPPAAGQLAAAVGGFFACGGDACYVVRVVDHDAAAASAVSRPDVAGAAGWRVTASFPWARLDPRTLEGAPASRAEGWTPVFEQARREGSRRDDPGAWGNGLEVTFQRSSLVSTTTRPGRLEEGWASRVASLAGLEPASVLELHQETAAGGHRAAVVGVAEIDPVRELVRWRERPEERGFDPERPIRLAGVEFDVVVRLDGREVERFARLAPDPAHGRALVRLVRAASRYVEIAPPAAADWSDPASWPGTTPVRLAGGRDGVARVGAADYLRALEAVAEVDDVALVAAPDLTLAAAVSEPSAPPEPPPVDCTVMRAPPPGRLVGRVVDASSGAERGLANVRVEVAAADQRPIWRPDGRFEVTGLEVGLATLRLTKPGYRPLDTQAQIGERPVETVFTLVPETGPRALDDDEILAVQQAMCRPERVGRYRIAVLDPPRPDLTRDALGDWRAKLGDTRRGAFYVPWLRLPGGTVAPPCGHVCGTIARAERLEGPHRAGANLGLAKVDGVTLAVDDAAHALMNPAGINVIRAFPGRGIRVHGTRSLASDPEWRFLTTRRLVDVVEKTLERSLQWAVFEPNGPITRQAVAFAIRTLLERVRRTGALAGGTPEAAYRVAVDAETNPPAVVDAGRLIAEVALAPAVPFEFIRFRLGRTLDALDVVE